MPACDEDLGLHCLFGPWNAEPTRWLLGFRRSYSHAFPLSIAAQWDEDAINVGVDLFRMLVK